MTTWAIEIHYEGGQLDPGDLVKYLVVDDTSENLMDVIVATDGHVKSFCARRTEPGDLARLAFESAAQRFVRDLGVSPEGGAPR